jgi:hypothetical protein
MTSKLGNDVLWFAIGILFLMPLQGFCGQIITVPSQGIATIQAAMISARIGDTVLVEPGKYHEKVSIKNGVTLKSKSLFGASMDGGGKGTVISLFGNASICGFEIKNGTIGILSTGMGNSITKCRIINNRQSGLSCTGQMPKVQDNIFAYNTGSGIVGWDVSAGSEPLSFNTIAYNENNGMMFGGASKVIIENNIVVFNARLGLKFDDGGFVVAQNNVFFQNGSMPISFGDKNISADPKFTEPKGKLDFSLMPDSPLHSLPQGIGDVGARLNY